ncbi:MAG: helix-turn-helix transcriptional regulator [Waddliaceae bacterium]
MRKSKDYEVTKGNVFADLNLDESDELLARAKLMHEVGSLIKISGLSQEEIAEKLGITQPKVSLLVTGKLSAFSTDTLLHYLALIGCKVKIQISKPSALSSLN